MNSKSKKVGKYKMGNNYTPNRLFNKAKLTKKVDDRCAIERQDLLVNHLVISNPHQVFNGKIRMLIMEELGLVKYPAQYSTTLKILVSNSTQPKYNYHLVQRKKY